MALTPEPSDPAPARDPDAYSRRPLFGVSFIVMMVLCLACVVGGYLFAFFGPRLFPVRAAPAAASTEPPPTSPWQASTTTTQLLVRPPAAAAASTAGPTAAVPSATDPNLPVPLLSPAADLAPRIADIEARQSAVLSAAAAALAAANLSQASLGGGPFAETFAAAAQVMPDSPDIRALQPLAAVGAPSRAALAAEFEGMIGPVAIAAGQPTSGAWDQFTYALSSIVTVRRIEPDAQGRSPPILRIERMVAGGDLEPALAAIAALPGAARDRLGGWRIRAERRVEIDRRVAGVRAEALARLQRLPRTAPQPVSTPAVTAASVPGALPATTPPAPAPDQPFAATAP